MILLTLIIMLATTGYECGASSDKNRVLYGITVRTIMYVDLDTRVVKVVYSSRSRFSVVVHVPGSLFITHFLL